MTPEALLEAFYQRLDAAIEEFEARYPCFRCPAGCWECCVTPPFLLSLVEYRFLCAYAKQHLPPEQWERIRRQAREQAQQYRLSEVLEAEQDSRRRDRLPRLLCPFLSEGQCLVYPARPLACRLFGRTIFTEGEDAGRFNGCTILLQQAQEAGHTGQTMPMYSADRLRAQMLRLNRWILDRGEMVALSTLVKFVADLGFEWSEEDVRRGRHAVFLPSGEVQLPEAD